MRINSGKMRYKVEFVLFGMTSDGAGGFENGATERIKTWADVEQIKSTKKLEALQLGMNNTYTLRFRSRKGFTPTVMHLVEYLGKTMSIISIERDPIYTRFTELVIQERTV